MAHDVFVSYSSQDKTTADGIVASLEANGIRCWIAPRDVLPGTDWGEALVQAIKEAGVMVLVFSGHANTSPQIRREIERAVDVGIPVVPVRIEDVMPSGSLEYFLGPQHWLDAWTPPLEQHLHRLVEAIKALLSKRLEGFDAAKRKPGLKLETDTTVGARTPTAAEPPSAVARAETPVKSDKDHKRKLTWNAPLVLVGFLVGAALVGGAVWWLSHQPVSPPIPQPPALTQKEGKPGPTKLAEKGMTAEDYFKKGIEVKDPQEKIEFYSRAIELNPNYVAAYNNRGNAYDAERDYDNALKNYSKALELNPNYPLAYNNRGLLYYYRKDYDNALSDFNKAIELDPNYTQAYVNRGLIYKIRKDYDQALSDYNKAIALDPNYALAYNNRGNVYDLEKDYDNARRDYNKAIELDSNLTIARNNLALLNKSPAAKVLFQDNFTTLDPSWGAPSALINAKDGKLTLTPDKDMSDTYLNQAKFLPNDLEADYTEVFVGAADPTYGSGLVFWARDYDSWYCFLINTNGWFAVQRHTNTHYVLPVAWRGEASLKKGVGAQNQVKLVTKGNQATIFINGKEVLSFTGQPPPGGSQIGFRAASGPGGQNSVAFSNFQVVQP